jgi:integrase/recombinase XerD
MKLREASRRYQLARRPELSPKTRHSFRHILDPFVRYIGPDRDVSHLRRSHIEAWLTDLSVAPATARGYLSVVRTFCRWMVASDLIKRDPTLGIKGPRAPVAMPRELDRAQIEKLLNAVPDRRARLVVMLGVHEGLRLGEIARLGREDIDLTGRLMLVHGKGSKQRWLPIGDETLQAIHAYLAEYPGTSGPIIRSVRKPNRGLSRGHLTKLVADWMRDAGVKQHAFDGKSGHALRHSCAGALLDDGADIRDVQMALGHSNLGATYVYLRRRQADGQLRKVMGQRTYTQPSPPTT